MVIICCSFLSLQLHWSSVIEHTMQLMDLAAVIWDATHRIVMAAQTDLITCSTTVSGHLIGMAASHCHGCMPPHAEWLHYIHPWLSSDCFRLPVWLHWSSVLEHMLRALGWSASRGHSCIHRPGYMEPHAGYLHYILGYHLLQVDVVAAHLIGY